MKSGGMIAGGLFVAGNQSIGASILPPSHTDLPEAGTFDFIFFTDTHIQPELDAARGCGMCFAKIKAQKADFAIQGGDHVFDASAVGSSRAHSLYSLYKDTEKSIDIPIHHVIGNHDIFGVYERSGVPLTEPGQGKTLYTELMGKTYYSFDHKGYHFIVLDSIQLTSDRSWEALIDPEQKAWLKADLEALPKGMPVIVTVHCPLVMGALMYGKQDLHHPPAYQEAYVSNAYEIIPMLQQFNVLGVLQGHIHINEVVTFNRIPYITAGAVSGNWWRGSHLGTPEGFMVVTLDQGKMRWRYETYGFQALAPRSL